MSNEGIEKRVQEAKDRLERAVNAVATAAQLLTQIHGVRVNDGVVVNLEEWRELQDALGEWREATQSFLSIVTTAARNV